MVKMGIDIFNEYSRNARLKPAFLVALPVAMLATGLGLNSSMLLCAISGPLTAAGLTFLLAQLSRDAGVRRQQVLFASWGGKASITKLRHRDTTLNLHTRSRYHATAEELLRRPMPTPDEEATNPGAADLLYEAYSNLLLERTRDTKKFRLLFEELVHYGFRRNLFAMKTVGVVVSLVCAVVEILLVAHAFRAYGRIDVLNFVFVALDLFLLLCWLILISEGWVKRAGEAYAERLLAASENLRSAAASPPQKEKKSGRQATEKSDPKRTTGPVEEKTT
jgi:hypothetical protein